MESICETGDGCRTSSALLPETNVSMFAGGTKSIKIIPENECNSSSSSSIGEDSDGDLEDDDHDDDEEAESSYNYDHYNNNNAKNNNDNGSFDDAIQALEQALPMRFNFFFFFIF